MRRIPASIILSVLLSAAWGAAVSMLYGFFPGAIPPGLYYPLTLSGVAAACGILHGIPLGRAAFAGLAAGFVYALLSPVFPLAGAALSGACLGGGMAREGRPGVLLHALKGALIFPVFVVSGVYVGSLVEYSGEFLTILFWAPWLGLAAGVITTPFFRGHCPGKRDGLDDRVREFSREAHGIEVDLRELYERMR